MEKVNRKPVLYAAIIALTLLLSKKAHASRPYSWIDERGPKVELHINGTLVASAPKEKADMVRSSLGKLERRLVNNTNIITTGSSNTKTKPSLYL